MTKRVFLMTDNDLADFGRHFLPAMTRAAEAMTVFAHQLELVKADAYGTLRSRDVPHWLARFIAHRWPWRVQ